MQGVRHLKWTIRAFGVDVVGELCQNLLDNGAPGLHFYTLNHAEATLGIWRQLDLQVSDSRAAGV